jgi:PKD repeat protein
MKKILLAFLLLLFTIPLASAQSVNIGDYSTVVDSEVIVPINISEAESIAGGVVNISFNSSIVSIDDVLAGDFGTPVANVNNTNGWVKLVAARIDAVNKNQAVLANIVFNGSSNGTSALTIEYASLNNETGALITPLTSNGKIVVSLSLDDTSPPSSIRDLVSYSGSSWINWTWTNPSDSDFNHTMVYLEGKFVDNTGDQYFNATNLIQGTIHTISTNTVDINGNINETWVNDTAKTTGVLSGGLHVTLNKPVNYSIYSVGEQVGFDVNVTDSDNNPISSGISVYVELSAPNNISKHIILSEEGGHFVGGYTVDNNDPRGLWLGNITVYNSTSSGLTSFKVYFTGAYFIQPYSNSRSYLLGESATLTAKVAKPGNPAQYLSDENVSLNLSIYPYNSSTPVLESIEMVYDTNSHLFSIDVGTDLIGSGLFSVLFIGNDTSGNIEVASLLIGVSEDYVIEVTTEKTDYDRDNPVNISGTVKYLNNSPISNINVDLLLDLHGFKRSYIVNTNEIGEFNYTFHPFDTEAGNYTIRATAANMGLLRTSENNFTIHGLYIVPQSAIVELVENSSRTISFTLYNIGDTTLTSISTSVNDLNISDNVIATIDPLSVPSELQPYESASFNLQIEAGTPIPDEAVFQIEVTTDQMSNEIGELDVKLFSPTPILKVYPEDILVGLNKNQTAIRTVGIYNMGYGNLRNVTLHQPENTWMRVTSNTSIGDLLPGENATFDIHINSYNVDLGVYFDSVNITSDNFNEVQVNLTAFVTDLQNGRLLFHVTDALERNLSNANISLINQETYEEFEGATNSTGYALMNNLPVGRYIFVVSSDGTNTLPQMGNVEVEAMDALKLIEISLYMSFIDFDWEVTPTSIEDYYNVILRMRFETDVPIPLLLAFPPRIDYNMVQGEEKTSSFKVYNVGLVSIYNVSISPINHNGIILDPLVTNVNEIKGKSSIEVPYKISLSSNAANCQRLSGKINIQGRYVHFINNREVISYARTSIPVTVKTPVDGSCIPDSPDWPDIKFCVNIDGLHIGDYTEDLKVNPNIIWLRTGPGWGDQKPPVLENVAIAKNNNTLGNVQLGNAMGITLSLGVNELVSYFTVGSLKPQIPLGVDVVDTIAEQYGINIPCFDGIWAGTFNPNLISPQQSASLDMEKLDTGVGLTLPKILGGGIIFNFGDEECYNCVWVIPIAGYDLTLPTFGLPEIEIYIPHVNLPDGGSSLGGGGGSVGSGDFCWNCVPDVFIPPSRPHFRGITYIPWDWPDWNWPDFSSDPIHRKPRPRVTETIHEVIELSISQNVTMERDAFWAGLGIRNKMPDKNIHNLGVTLHLRDATGSANDKFFIKAPQLKGISNIDGSGVVAPSGLATSQWLIIPKPGAGGINPDGAKYNISANITYSVDGINFETVTYEVEILVKPQPEMVLDYFIPSDVIANKPFKLAVKVTNEGYGEARNFAIETAQPVIYYNPSGLLIDFEIIRSQLQGEERSTSMKVDFGDIQPGESKIAWWDMVTSIDGTFTEFTGEFTHSSELGGMETSLIKELNTYIIQKQLGTGELGYDFLANSESDENYYVLFNSSTGSSTFVNNANYAVVNMPTPENPVLDVSIEDYTGEWVIVSLEDPHNNEVQIEKVIRTSDGTEIPSYNYWMMDGRILIVDHYDDEFDGKYSIIFSGMPEPGITVTSPNGGEEWYVSNTHTIQWVYAGDLGSNVKIELLNSEGNTINITSSTSIGSDGTGSYNWKIPLALASGTDYRVKVTSITNGYYNDLSDGHFTIDLPSAPKIISGPKINMTNSNSVIVQWETDISSNSSVTYGKSPVSYECITYPSYNTKHEVELTNINYQQTYYYNFSSSNELGDTVESDEYNFKFIASSSIDGYNFENWTLKDEELNQWFDAINPLDEHSSPMNVNPIYNFYQVLARLLTQWGGHCWGMASTSILYFENEIDKPDGYEKSDTINITKDAAQEDINYYQPTQMVPKYVDHYYSSSSNFNGHEEFVKIVDSINKNKPLLMQLYSDKKVAHAVTPIGYSTRENSGIIYIYDNTMPRETHEIEVNQNSINYIDNPYQKDDITFIEFDSFEPEKEFKASDFRLSLRILSNSLKGKLGEIKSYIISLKCPADLRIVDQYGRVITTLNGETNEIPDAELKSGEEFELYNLPSDLEYTVEMIGTGTGKADLSFASKDIILTFNDIPITSLTKGKMYIGRTNSYILSLDNNNDGIIDEYITPMIDTYTENGYNISFLPPITTMDQFNFQDGSTLPIKFTVRNSSTDEFTYDTTVNVTITNSTGNVIAYFTNGTGNNSVRINSIDEQYAVDFNTNDYHELIIGKPYSIQVTFGDIGNLQGYAIAYFTLINGTPPSSITHLHPTAGTTWLNWTWTNPSDPDFNHTEIYLVGVFRTITSAEHFNATNLAPETSYTISTRTVDTSGNINQTWLNNTTTTLPASDTNPPIITITSPVSGTTYRTDPVNLNYSVNEPTAWQGYSLDGTANITLHGNTTLTGFADGLHTLTVSANDTSGNMNSSTVCFTIATTTPAVNTVTLNTTTPNTGDSILVTVNATDNVAVISVAANDVVLSPQSGDIWTGTVTAIAGIHYVNVSATDAAGNVGWNNSASYTATTPDTIPPAAIANLHPTVGTTWINWTWTNPSDPDFNHTEIYLNGTFQTITSAEFFNATGLIPNTEYEISTRAADNLGNINETWVNDTAMTLDTPPVSNASGPYTGIEGQAIIFNASASYDPDPGDSIASFEWDFNNDGATDATGVEVTWTWNDDYAGQVNLTVTDSHGKSSTDTTSVTILNAPPEVEAGNNQTVNEGDTVSFIGDFTDPGIGDTHTIEWNFGDGTPGSTGTLEPTHVYADNGTYTVTLTVTDDDAASTSDTLNVTVENLAPIVDAGEDQTANEGDIVSFAGSFTDPGTADTHLIEWDFGDTTPISSGTLTPTHTYADNGTYTVNLTITDDDGASTLDTLIVTINNVVPVLDECVDQTVQWGDTMTFSRSFTDPGDDSWTAEIDWGDDSQEEGILSSKIITATHIYLIPGEYICTLTVQDDDGGVGSGNMYVTVTTRATELEYIGDLSAQYSDYIDLKAQLNDSGNNNPLPNKSINFILGTQTATATTGPDGIATTSFKLDQPTGSYDIKAEFAGDGSYSPDNDTEVMQISREDAKITYTGDAILPTTAGSIDLRATLEEIDTDYGDLTKINVNFTIYKGSDLSYSNPIAIIPSIASISVTSSGMGVGTATATINNLPEDDYMLLVRIVPNDYYQSISSNPTPMIVYNPTGQFTTGGGWIWDPTGSHGNFGFNVKYNKKGKVQGNSIYVYRLDGFDYIVKSNAWIGLAISDNTSSFQGKAVLQIFDPVTGELQPESSGNFQFTVEAMDNELNGNPDYYKITVLDKEGLEYHNATGSLEGGNIVIHDKKSK